MTLNMLRCLLAILFGELAIMAQMDVPTYHNDNARTGQYLAEALLTPSNVKAGSFGSRFSHLVDGPIYAQPLYMRRVKITGKGLHNVVFVATAHDSLYAFDADDASGSNADPLWQVSFTDPSHGITAVPYQDVDCPVIQPELGIIGTPVLDVQSGTIYLIAQTKEPGSQYFFRLHALDVTNGTERAGSPVVIQPPGFVPLAHKQRGALLLANGVIYSPWSSHCDRGSYHGWILAHDAATLSLRGVFNSSPEGNGGSFWNGGCGPAADSDGSIYTVSANGDFNASAGGSKYGDAVLKLSPAPNFAVASYFAPFNIDTLNDLDLDLGSSGTLILPDEAGTPQHPHLLFTAGKEGRMYLLDRDHLGGAQTGTDGSALASQPLTDTGLFGIGAYFNNTIYVGPQKSKLHAFSVSGAVLGSTPSASSSETVGTYGAIPSISADHGRNGIVWVLSTEEDGTLRAYDAAHLTQLYDSNQQPADAMYGYAEFSVPTIADGKVFVGTYYTLTVFGLINHDRPEIVKVTNAASFATEAVAPGSIVAIFGSALSSITVTASESPLPISLADVSVAINGAPAPLMYVSPGQINAQVPFGIASGPATLTVRSGPVVSVAAAITIQPAAPGVFAVVNADGSRNTPETPAAPNSVASVYFTGQGMVSSPQEDGAAAEGVVRATASPVDVTVGDISTEVPFLGLAPHYAGLAQMNMKIPTLPTGTYPLVINIAGAASKPTMIHIAAPKPGRSVIIIR